jgi:hypothetical protein
MANKIGDIALLLCCVALQLLYKSVDYATVFTCVECASTYDDTNAYILVDQLLSHADYQLTNYILGYDVGAGDVQALVTGHSVMLHCATAYNRLIRSCLVIAAVGKSAQAGLHM